MSQAQSYAYFDELRSANADRLERRGTLDILPAGAATSTGANGTSVDMIGRDLALCHLSAFWRYSTLDEDPTTGELRPRSLGPGFFGDSSSVLLAAHHFNNGMGVVVDEVEGIDQRCPFRFTVEFFDTFSSLPRTIETMTNLQNRPGSEGPKPCAVLGAFRSAVSTPLSILTGVYGLPQLSPVSSSPGLDNTNLHPLFSRLVPSDAGTSELTVKYLQDLGVHHVGVINVDDAYGSAYRQAFQRIAEAAGMSVSAVSFPFNPTAEQIESAIAQLRRSGYRYFFGIIFGPEHYDRK